MVRTDIGWRLDPSVTFLNHGSFGACPEPVLAAQHALRERLERQPVAFMDRELPVLLDRARASVAAFLGADPDGLAFVPNATTGVNAVLRSLRFEPGDRLLTDDHEYNAILTTLRATAARDGAALDIAHIPFPPETEDEVVDALLEAVTPRTRLAVISHVTSPTALVLPIERIVRALHALGIDTLVDGAHAPGMVPMDVDRLGAAYYTGNGHKWLCGPKGSAFLWVRADRRDRIRPVVTSHGANDPRTDRSRFRLEFDWVGTSDPTPALTLPAAIDWMAGQVPGGWPEIMATNRGAALAARDRLMLALGIASTAPDAMIGSMVALRLPGRPSDDAARSLHDMLIDLERIEVPIPVLPVRGARARATDAPTAMLVRVSMQRYNDASDVERLVGALGRRATAE
jgi:isopenicillin-N epimerase